MHVPPTAAADSYGIPMLLLRCGGSRYARSDTRLRRVSLLLLQPRHILKHQLDFYTIVRSPHHVWLELQGNLLHLIPSGSRNVFNQATDWSQIRPYASTFVHVCQNSF